MRLLSWYRENRQCARISNLTVGMVLGTAKNVLRPCVRAKGAESKGIMFFARAELAHFVAEIGTTQSRMLLAACDSLVSWYNAIDGSGRVISPALVEQLVGHIVNHNTLFAASGGTLAPKNHLWMHLTRQAARNGNPRFGSTYPDESLNGVFAKVCRTTHPTTLPLMCMKKYYLLRTLAGSAF